METMCSNISLKEIVLECVRKRKVPSGFIRRRLFILEPYFYYPEVALGFIGCTESPLIGETGLGGGCSKVRT